MSGKLFIERREDEGDYATKQSSDFVMAPEEPNVDRTSRPTTVLGSSGAQCVGT